MLRVIVCLHNRQGKWFKLHQRDGELPEPYDTLIREWTAIRSDAEDAPLKRQAKREFFLVGGSIGMSHSNLDSSAHRQRQVLMNHETAQADSRREKDLLLAVVWSAHIEAGVDFHFRPELSPGAILESIV